MRKKAVELAKGQEDEKVGISLKIPKNLKDRLQLFSEQENVSMNSLITSCIELMLDDSCGNILKQIDIVLTDEIAELSDILNRQGYIEMEEVEEYEKTKITLDKYLSLLHQVRKFI